MAELTQFYGIQNLGIEKYSIFGWSQGGGTAIFLAAEYPSAVINFVTLGSGSCNNEQIIRVYKGEFHGLECCLSLRNMNI